MNLNTKQDKQVVIKERKIGIHLIWIRSKRLVPNDIIYVDLIAILVYANRLIRCDTTMVPFFHNLFMS